MTNLPANEIVYKTAGGRTYDLSVYSSMMEFLSDIWDAAFAYYDAKYPTSAAEIYAIKAQDRAELFWRYHLGN